jgi:hypothetical protein
MIANTTLTFGTDAQKQVAREITQRPDFRQTVDLHFCEADVSALQQPKVRNFLWYDAAGQLHLERLARSGRVLLSYATQ